MAEATLSPVSGRACTASEVEFVDLAGEIALVTVEKNDVRPVRRREIAHARMVA